MIAGAAIAAGLNAAHVPVPTGLQFFLMSPFLHLSVHGSLLVFAVVLITLVTAVAALLSLVEGGAAAAGRRHVPLRMNQP